MKYRLIFAAVLAVTVTTISASGAMAQNHSKEQRKPTVDTMKKSSGRPAAPVLKPAPKADTAKKAGKKH